MMMAAAKIVFIPDNPADSSEIVATRALYYIIFAKYSRSCTEIVEGTDTDNVCNQITIHTWNILNKKIE